MKPLFEVFKDKKGEWRFRLRATNGKIIAVSEGYASKRNAVMGTDSVKANAGEAGILYLD